MILGGSKVNKLVNKFILLWQINTLKPIHLFVVDKMLKKIKE